MKKRLWSLLLALVMTLSCLAGAILPTAAASSPVIMLDGWGVSAQGQTGYSADNILTSIPTDAIPLSALGMDAPEKGSSYTISSADELILLSRSVNAGNTFHQVYLYLTDDINMAGKTMDPIGNGHTALNAIIGSPYFGGVFDGQGHAIQNLVMTSSSSADNVNVALFGEMHGAAVINLRIDSTCSFTYTGTNATARVAAVVGYIVSVNADGDQTLGYALGRDSSGAIMSNLVDNVESKATVSAGVGTAGGAVGAVSGMTSWCPYVLRVTVKGSVSGAVAGGVVGQQYGNRSDRPLMVRNCFVQASVKGTTNTNTYCNVLLGVGKIENCTTAAVPSVAGVSNILTLKSSGVFNETAYQNGTEWKITNAEGLVLLSEIVNSKNHTFFGKTVYLANDINMAGVTDFTPIGNYANATLKDDNASTPSKDDAIFRGTFNGNGYSIQNLTLISKEEGSPSLGLFGVLRDGKICNLVIDSTCIFLYLGSSNTAKIAALVGCGFCASEDTNWGMWPDSETYIPYIIENVTSYATVRANAGYAGGIVGAIYARTNHVPSIKGCANYGDVSGAISAAGILGAVTASRSVKIENCINAGVITAQDVNAICYIVLGHFYNEGNKTAGSTLNSFSYTGYSEGSKEYGGVIGYSKKRVQTVDLSAIPEITTLTGGSNTTSKAYKISSADSLCALSTYVNAGNSMQGVTVYLAKDINMSGKSMRPIGSPATTVVFTAGTEDAVPAFSGTFDGQGYTIDNLVMNYTTDSGRETALVGLFGMLKGATVRNLSMGKGCSFTYTRAMAKVAYVGGIAAAMYDAGKGSVIENCYSAVSLKSADAASGIVAGLLSANGTGAHTVTGCTYNGTIDASKMAAGIVGRVSNAAFTVFNCRNLGMVSCTNTRVFDSYAAAGIVGDTNTTHLSSIRRCVNEGKITSPTNLGGVVGIDHSVAVSIADCTNYGELSLTVEGDRVGAIYGWHATGTYGHMTNNTDATSTLYRPGTAVRYVGSQIKDNGSSYDVRFLAAIDSLSPDAIGFMMEAVYADGSHRMVLSDPQKIETTVVYKSVLETVDGTAVTAYAEDYEGLYLMAITVRGIADSLGDVIFTIKPYMVQDDETLFLDGAEVAFNAGALVGTRLLEDIWAKEEPYLPDSESEQVAKDTGKGSANGAAFYESFSKDNGNWTNHNTANGTMTYTGDGKIHFLFKNHTSAMSASRVYAANGAADTAYAFEVRMRIEYFGVNTVLSINCNGYRSVLYLYESKLRVNLDRGTSTDVVGKNIYYDIGSDWHTYRMEMRDGIGSLYIDGQFLCNYIPEGCGATNEMAIFAQAINATNAGEVYMDYVSYTPLTSSSLKITSPTAGAVVGTGTASVTVNVSGASSGVSYYLNGQYAGTTGSSITFQNLKPGVYTVYAKTSTMQSAERVFYVNAASTTAQSATDSTASALQSSYMLSYTVGGMGMVKAGDGVFPLTLAYMDSGLTYMTDEGSKTLSSGGNGSYVAIVDGGVATIYKEGKQILSFRMPYDPASCPTNATTTGGVTGLSVTANNGTLYKTTVSGTANTSVALGVIPYQYSMEFEYTYGNKAEVSLRDGGYLVHLSIGEDGAINGVVAPQMNAFSQLLCQAKEGKNLYRVQVCNGIAQLYINNIWVASWRCPTCVADRGVSLIGGGLGLFRICEAEDLYYFTGKPTESTWKQYFGSSGDQGGIYGLNNLKVYAKETVVEATISVGSSTSGLFYLDARYFGGGGDVAHRGVFAGYDFNNKQFKMGEAMATLSSVKSQTLSAGTHTLKLKVSGQTAYLYCDGTLIASQTVTMNGWGNAGYVQNTSGVTITSFHYEGDSRPLCDTTTHLYSQADGYSHTVGIFELDGKVYISGESSDVQVSSDGGKTFTSKTGDNSHYGYNTIVLQSGKLLSLKRTYIKAHGGYQYVAYLSSDGGNTFEGPYVVQPHRNPYRFTMNGKVMQASNGRVFFVSGETEDENVGRLWIYYSDDEGKSWTRAESEFCQATTGTNLQEGMIVELNDGVLRMYARNDQGFLVYSDSYDGGVTWDTDMKNSNFISVVSAFNVTRDPETGAIYLAWEYNNTNDHTVIQQPRTRLALAVSYDGAETWQYVGDFDDENLIPKANTWIHWNIGVWVTSGSVFVSIGKMIGVDKWNNYTVRIGKNSIQPLARFTSVHSMGQDPQKNTEGERLVANSVLAISENSGRVYASGDLYQVNRVRGMRTMITAQMIASFLNGTYTISNGTATIKVGNQTYVFKANSNIATVAGSSVAMTYAAIAEDGTVKITLQDLCDLMGFEAACTDDGGILVMKDLKNARTGNLLALVGIW